MINNIDPDLLFKAWKSIDMNLVTAAILTFIYVVISRKNTVSTTVFKFLSITVKALLALLLLEAATHFLNAIHEPSFNLLSFWLNLLLYLIPSIAAFSFSHFVYSYIHEMQRVNLTYSLISAIPLIINSIVILTNPFTNIAFTIDPSGIYKRGIWYYATLIVMFIYLLQVAITIFIYRAKIAKKEFYTFNLFWILPIIGGVIQTFLHGTSILWNFSAFSVIIILFYSEGKLSKIDNLTGALTRSNFEFYLDSLKDDSNIGIAILDLDDFKSINSSHGRITGDLALKTFSNIILKNIDAKDTFVRYGGDEFMICFESKTYEEIKNTILLIENEVEKLNNRRKYVFNLKFTSDYDLYDKSKYYNITHLLKTIDANMHAKKLEKKLCEYTDTKKREYREQEMKI